MRARNIKPAFFKNEELVKLPEAVRLLFIGLWCLADRRGRLEDRPARIKMEIYPCDPHDVSTMLDLLQHHAFIIRYERNENHYIQIINFEKHQYPHIREQESTIPAPCKPGASTMQARLNPESLDTESPLLNTASQQKTRFEEIWNRYPKRLGRKDAEKHFRASVKTDQDWEEIKRALENYQIHLRAEATEPNYIKHGSTWFNNWREWVNYQEVKDARHVSEGVHGLSDLARRALEIAGVRKTGFQGSAGPVLSPVRNVPMPEKSTEKSE